MQDDVVARNWRELIRPRRLDVEEGTLTSTYGRFYCEPLERGRVRAARAAADDV